MPDDSVFCVATRTRSVSPLTIGSFKDIRVHGVASDYSTKRLAYRNPTSDSDQMQGTTCGLYPNDLSRGQRVARGRSLVVALPCQKKFWPAVSAARRETLFAAAATNGMAQIYIYEPHGKEQNISVSTIKAGSKDAAEQTLCSVHRTTSHDDAIH